MVISIYLYRAGHSNLTYSLGLGEWEAVLRRPPLGPVAPKAHDMEREFTVLTHLHPIFPAAPKPYAFCDDETIIGSPFMIMERKRGIVLDTAFFRRSGSYGTGVQATIGNHGQTTGESARD
ncbi:phosphotransferase [Bacillus testis]|uniref:phosphotransferase n=1 Tax=Bacillus testis TaxID=1622072 RepID=UPI00067EA9C4